MGTFLMLLVYGARVTPCYGLEKGSAESAVGPLIDRGEAQRRVGGFVIVDPLLERWLKKTQR